MLSFRVGCKLSMPVYLAPNPPGYHSKIIVLIILNVTKKTAEYDLNYVYN